MSIRDIIMAAAGANQKVEWTFVGSATGTSNATVPAAAQAGDVGFFVSYGDGSLPTDVTPTNWTGIDGSLTNGGTNRLRTSYRIFPSGLGGTSVSGISGSTRSRAILIVMRPGVAIGGIAIQSLNGEATAVDPTSQSVTSGSGTLPLFVLGIYASNADLLTPSFSPSEDAEIQASGDFLRVKYKIYNASPANVTVDMGDDGNNIMQSFYVEAT